MAKKYDVVAGNGEYQDRDGNTKVRWQNCGAVFEKDGKLSLKLECLPIGKDFDGWLKLFEPKQRQNAQPRQSQDDFNDDIPF